MIAALTVEDTSTLTMQLYLKLGGTIWRSIAAAVWAKG